MASENVKKKLKQLLERGSDKDAFEEDINWLQSIHSGIHFRWPILQTFSVKGVSQAWRFVYPSPDILRLEQVNFLV